MVMTPWGLLLLFVVVTGSLGHQCPYAEKSAREKRQVVPAPTPPPPPAPTNYNAKPGDNQWIRGADPRQKTGLVQWLTRGCWTEENGQSSGCGIPAYRHVEYPGYDGWYNNPAHPELGAVDTPLLRRVPAYYEDSVYEPVVKGRPNPLLLSNHLMNGSIGTQSRTGKTALLVFFGQQMVEEILDSQRAACPPEYFNIPIPDGHEYRERPGHTMMPLLRTRFDARTGFSPGNPRQQLNEITPWLDGGLTYGTSKAWADQLRRYKNGTVDPNGLLAAANDSWRFPEYNTHRLPLANPPPPALHHNWVNMHETAKVNRFFKLGNPRGNENPFLLTFGVVWFRWHNHVARELRAQHADWSSERIFNEARKWVIASHQQVVINEWLPIWLGENNRLDPYQSNTYNAALDPQIDQFFQSAAMRFGHTLVTPGVYLRDYVRNGCGLLDPATVRTCNFFWRPQDPMLQVPRSQQGHSATYNVPDFADIDRLLMGMASQLTEEEDNIIVEDLRGRVFGPLEFSRRDLMAINIQRGRDHGLPDFNTARKAYGLAPITDESHFVFRARQDPTVLTRLKNIYSHNESDPTWVDRIDVWVGGILETGDGPGELFTAVIRDQFTRIRNADRFWFERPNELFTPAEIERLHRLRFRDIIMSVTQMENDDIQQNPFLAPRANEVPARCRGTNNFADVSCGSGVMCGVLPPLDSSRVDRCVDANTYDYFSNSEVSYILTFLCLGLFVTGLISMLFCMNNLKERNLKKDGQRRAEKSRASFSGKSPFSVQEWVGRREGFRGVVVLLNAMKRQIEICCQFGTLVRAIDVTNSSTLHMLIATDGLHVLLRVAHDYDLVIRFDSNFLRDNFLMALESFVSDVGINRERINISLQALQKQAVTKANRQKRLEMFFRVVFSQAFNIKHSNEAETLKIDTNVAREVIYTELTSTEFAEALSMKPDSEFVRKMFALVDKDKNGFISFREFVDMLVIFSKGSADDKAKLMFDMYDINGTGQLTRGDFTKMLQSLMETVSTDGSGKSAVDDEHLQKVVNSMMESANLSNKEVMSLADFQRLLGDYKDKIGLAQLNIAGMSTGPPSGSSQQTVQTRQSFAHRARDTAISIYGSPLDYRQGAQKPVEEKKDDEFEKLLASNNVQIVTERRAERVGPVWLQQLTNYMQTRRLEIFWCILYTLVLIAIFAERAYYYSVEREHSGLRRIAGYGVTVTRGAASAMMFTYSTLLVTMCRNSITRLRDTFLHLFIPFDSAVEMHKYIAIWALIFTIMHSVGHAFNFYHISTQTSDDLTCLFRNYFHATHEIPKFHYWCWQTITGFTGVLLFILTAIIFTFSLPYTRARLFNWFWFTHSLYPIFFLLMILHGAGRLIQPPFFHYFFLGPCILFVLDSMVSITRKKIEIPVIKAELLPSGVTMLEFKKPAEFDYKPGQWVRIACKALNSGEYHPFTISSAPNEENLTVHIRAVGPWTNNIRRIYDRNNLVDRPLPKIHLDGPYGESHQDWFKYEVSVLVGAGIGVTPFASILKDIVYNSNNTKKVACKKVYFLWVTKTQKTFEWLVDILRELENADSRLVVSVHIFITQYYEKFDLRTILLYICERHFQRISGRSLFTGLKAVTHFGRPNIQEYFKNLQIVHPKVHKIGVFSCGPSTLTQGVDKACDTINKETSAGPLYEYHSENF